MPPLRNKALLLCTLLCLLHGSAGGQALLVPQAVTSSTSASDQYGASQLIDGSGLASEPTLANYFEVEHDRGRDTNCWRTDQPGASGSDYFAESDVSVTLTFSLGASHLLDSLIVWDYHRNVPNNDVAQSLEIAFSNDGGDTWSDPITLQHSRGLKLAERLQFSPQQADTVRVSILDNHFGTPGAVGGERVALAEVRFTSAPPQDPTPRLEIARLLDLGNLGGDESTSTADLIVRNVGHEDPLVVQILPSPPPFSVVAEDITITSGETATIQVAFDPPGVTGCYSGFLTITSNDPDRPSAIIRLLGSLECAHDIPSQPKLSPTEGTFIDPFEVTITSDDPEITLIYTTDGSLPSFSNSLPYTGPITVTESVQIRAAAVRGGQVSKPQTKSYLKLAPNLQTYQSTLPIALIDNFGRGSVPDKGWTIFHQTGEDLEQVPFQAAFLQILDRDPETGLATTTGPNDLSERIGIRVRGALSSTWNPKPYRLETWDEFDNDKTTKPLGLPGESDWILYYPHPIFDPTLLSNTFTWDLSRETGRYATRYRFVEVFLNEDGGDLSLEDRLGVYVLAEKVKRDDDRIEFEQLSEDGATGGWLLSINRMDPEPIGGFPAENGATSPQFFHTAGPNRILESAPNGPGQGDDRPAQFNNFLNFEHPGGYEINPAQRQTIEGWFQEFEDVLYDNDRWLDPETGYRAYLNTRDFIDYFHISNLAKQGDALLLSIFPWVSSDERKLHMGPLWDFNNGAYQATSTGPMFHRGFRLWYPRLFLDPSFLNEYIDRWFELRRGPFSNAAMHALLDRQAAEFTNDLVLRQGHTIAGWNNSIVAMKDYLADRSDWLDAQFFQPPTFSQQGGIIDQAFSLTITNQTGTAGSIYLTTDGSDPMEGNGALYDAPLQFSETTHIRARIQDADGNWSALNEATFITGRPPQPGELVISELSYHPEFHKGGEFLELLNVHPSVALDLSLVRFTAGIDFTFPPGTMLAPGERLLLVRDQEIFDNHYGGRSNVLGKFQSNSALDNSGDHMELVDSTGAILLKFSYDDRFPWPRPADGDGSSLVLSNPFDAPEHGDPASWRTSRESGGSPGQADSLSAPEEPSADLDGDRLTALLEYALGTSDESQDSLDELLDWSFTEDGIALNLVQNLAAVDATLILESSSDLESWVPLPNPSLQDHLPGGKASFHYELEGPQPPQLFFRLRANAQ